MDDWIGGNNEKETKAGSQKTCKMRGKGGLHEVTVCILFVLRLSS